MNQPTPAGNIANTEPPETAPDAVDRIIAQWLAQGVAKEPLAAMQTIGRIKRIHTLTIRALDANFKTFGLTSQAFDVLATLRRAGKPYTLTPTELFTNMMVSSGTMTNRLQQLEHKGLITRKDNPDDKRSRLVCLSEAGLTVLDRCLDAHLALENQLLAGLDTDENAQLNRLLKKLEARLPEYRRA